MRIRRARFENFRCLADVEVVFDSTTTLIGPNGVGKSSILRGLDWFFNGSPANPLTDDDVCVHGTGKRIRVEVEFTDLTDLDRERLGSYAPPGTNTALLWRTWENGIDRFSGKARSFKPFQERVRIHAGARERTTAYRELRTEQPDLGLPAVNSAAAADAAMLIWEREHPDRLEDTENDTSNVFGFLGNAQLSGLFGYVMVTADLRATEETQDVKTAIIGRLLEKTVDRLGAEEELTVMLHDLEVAQDKLIRERFHEQLAGLSKELSDAVKTFTSGRQVVVGTKEVKLKPQRIQFVVNIQDREAKTSIDRQGHGFQRSLLLSTLRYLAESERVGSDKGVVCLAIEEPELFGCVPIVL